MKELYTLGRTTWDKIEIGEIYMEDGCCQILEKRSHNESMLICDDFSEYIEIEPGEKWLAGEIGLILYKLPLSVQRLWKTEI